MQKKDSIIAQIKGGLIVSCQALPDEPLHGAHIMAAMANAAQQGGAIAIRANGPEDIAAIHHTVALPIIGLFKDDLPGYEVRITPTIEHARQIAAAGADIIAFDATQRQRPDNLPVKQMIAAIHELGKPAFADISTFEEGLQAAEDGADFVGITLSGYTSYSPLLPGPDFVLLDKIVKALQPKGIPVIAEGRISTPQEVVFALHLGAHAVVVGSAITRPQWITAQFTRAIQNTRKK